MKGRVTNFVLMTAARPVLEALTIDVRELALGSGMPAVFNVALPSMRESASSVFAAT